MQTFHAAAVSAAAELVQPEGKGQDMTIAIRAAAALLAVLLAACEGYGPTAPAGDSVEAETVNPDASGTGGIDDAYGTEMP